MSITDEFAVVEIYREKYIDPKNKVTIDGKELKGIRNVKIEYGLDKPLPIITLEFLAKKVKGKIKGMIKEGKK